MTQAQRLDVEELRTQLREARSAAAAGNDAKLDRCLDRLDYLLAGG